MNHSRQRCAKKWLHFSVLLLAISPRGDCRSATPLLWKAMNAMFVVGQSRPNCDVRVMSALPVSDSSVDVSRFRGCRACRHGAMPHQFCLVFSARLIERSDNHAAAPRRAENENGIAVRTGACRIAHKAPRRASMPLGVAIQTAFLRLPEPVKAHREYRSLDINLRQRVHAFLDAFGKRPAPLGGGEVRVKRIV